MREPSLGAHEKPSIGRAADLRVHVNGTVGAERSWILQTDGNARRNDRASIAVEEVRIDGADSQVMEMAIDQIGANHKIICDSSLDTGIHVKRGWPWSVSAIQGVGALLRDFDLLDRAVLVHDTLQQTFPYRR